MASSVADLQAIVDAIDARILAKMTGADVAKFKLGDESIESYSIAELGVLRDKYQKQIDELAAGTEYWDTFDQGVDNLTGEDNTVGIGDIED